MTAQGAIVAIIVIACCVYAAWTLMPGAARRALAGALLKWPLPAAVIQRLQIAARVPSTCGCDGCDRSAVAPKPKVVRFHPRLRR